MERGSGISGGMGVRMESRFMRFFVNEICCFGYGWRRSEVLLTGTRKPEQVAERMDGVIRRIRELQKGAMRGEKSADVLVVCLEDRGHELCIGILYTNKIDRSLTAIQ